MASPVIEYRRGFRFAVSPAELWSALEQADNYETWWPWLRDFQVEGALLCTGSVLRGVVAPPLPYRMRIEVELLRCASPTEVDAAVHGDLEGTAALRLFGEGGGTRAEVSWTIEMMQRPMRLACRFAKPLLRVAHDVVVEMTVAGMRRHLAEDRP